MVVIGLSDVAWSHIGTMVTVVIGFLTMWLRLKYNAQQVEEKSKVVEDKIDVNTQITKAGTTAAATNAVEAKAAAAAAKTAAEKAAERVEQGINGSVDAAIEASIKPLRDAFQDHVLQDEANMTEIRQSLDAIHRKLP